MTDSFHPFASRNGVSIPKIWVALALSVLLHIAALWKMPQVHLTSPELGERGGPLTVELAPPPAPPAARAPQPRETRPEAKPRASRSQAPSRPPPPPPVIAQKQPEPAIVTPRPSAPPVAAPSPSPSPESGDLASYIEARRRARGDAAQKPAPPQTASSAPAEDENARANRIAAANLGLDRRPSFGPDRTRGGGIFDITRMGYDSAEFAFYGWNKDIQRDTTQRIEVRKGANSDIRIAVVRRMIAIIRDHEQEDFVWESQRLNRNVTLSARMRDNAGLEEFLMREFFDARRRPASIR